jgi:peptide/nickel transport system ATP-binding protein
MRVVDLGCVLGPRALLIDVAFDASDGPLALLGPSGSGKSLTLRCLLGLAPAGARVRGELHLNKDGPPVDLADRRALAALRGRGLTLLPQDAAASLDPVRRVAAQLRELLQVHANREDTPEGLLELVGLRPELLRRYPHEISGGQAQRVALALALACRPAVLLVDEPTAALDNLAQMQAITVLQTTCAAREVDLVFVTHDLALAARVCRHAVIMDSGCIVEADTMAAIVARPAHLTTRSLVAAARRADDLWQLVDGADGREDMS